MNRTSLKRACFLLFVLVSISVSVFAQQSHGMVKIHFNRGQSNIDTTLFENEMSLKLIKNNFDSIELNQSLHLVKAIIVGSASPEGSVSYNDKLAMRRVGMIKKYIKQSVDIQDSTIISVMVGVDWQELRNMVLVDTLVPFRSDVLALLYRIIDEVENGYKGISQLKAIESLHDGESYRYMRDNFFPKLRATKVFLLYEKSDTVQIRIGDCTKEFNDSTQNLIDSLSRMAMPQWRKELDTVFVYDTLCLVDTLYRNLEKSKIRRIKVNTALKTNLLFDAFATPNMGVEFYIDKNFTLGFTIWSAWWNSDKIKYYHRTYGGELEGRYYLNLKNRHKKLRGHHLGIYAQTLTYDFLFGERAKGYLSNEKMWNYGAGLSYGYSLPVGEHINFDFSLGVGYLGGVYSRYMAKDDCYVSDGSFFRNYFGVTKLAISFVYVIE